MLYTIGHSNHAVAKFLALLHQHGIDAIADVRSVPHSRFHPQFGRGALERSLEQHALKYYFLGEELGARSKDPDCYREGKVQYELLARSAPFARGIDLLRHAMRTHRIAMMCAEREPLECHRAILVAPRVRALGIEVSHILADGSLETHDQALDRLIRQLKIPGRDMFRSRDDLVEEAYRLQSERIAYVRP